MLLIILSLVGYLIYQKQSIVKPFYPIPTAAPDVKPSDPPQTDGSDWKTYIDSSIGFSLKYPNTWEEDKSLPGILFKDITVALRKLGMGLGIETFENIGNLSAQEFLYKIYYDVDKQSDAEKQLNNLYIKNNKYISIQVDGLNATQFDLTVVHGSNGTGVWIVKNNNGILLRFLPVPGEKELIPKIPSSFKFNN